MEEKLITELKELSLIFNKIQDNITRAENLQKSINEVLDNEEYIPSEEVQETINTLENQAKEIYESFKKLYN